MKKPYQSPEVVEFGSVAELTAAYGSDPDPDIVEFPGIPVATGSFDICEDGQCGD